MSQIDGTIGPWKNPLWTSSSSSSSGWVSFKTGYVWFKTGPGDGQPKDREHRRRFWITPHGYVIQCWCGWRSGTRAKARAASKEWRRHYAGASGKAA